MGCAMRGRSCSKPSRSTVQRSVAAGDTASAVQLYERIVRLEPPIPDLYNEYGVLLAQQRRLPMRRAATSKAVALRPQNVPARLNLATALALQGQVREAEPLLQSLVADRPDNVRAQVMLGNIAMQRQDAKAAEQAYRHAAAAHPETGQIWYLLGESLRQQNDCRRAVDAYETAVARDPSLAPAHRALAACYKQLGENDKAARAVAGLAALSDVAGTGGRPASHSLRSNPSSSRRVRASDSIAGDSTSFANSGPFAALRANRMIDFK
jgi:cytochrome c-type biogenesis protein CcmH/NrfG